MLIDITLKITAEMLLNEQKNENRALAGHLGTHFDVMDKTFPLEYIERKAVVFDVSSINESEISSDSINLSLIEPDMFVAFYTGYIDSVKYGCKQYFASHPQLSNELIDKLLEKCISIIGIDFAGVRCGVEHTPKDQHCADSGVFIVENLCNLKEVLGDKPYEFFTANTYPMNYANVTGLPCRVIANK